MLTSNSLNGSCGSCGHIFVVAHLPMPMERAAGLARCAACPKCGEADKVFVTTKPPVETVDSGEKSP